MPNPTGVRVNAHQPGDQYAPALIPLTGGGYVATWVSDGQDGSGGGVYMQLYDAAGASIGGEIPVNTNTANSQLTPQGAGLAGGGFVIVYSSTATGDADIVVQRFDSSGAAAGAETTVNTTTALAQIDPSVTALADGGYVVVWSVRDSGAHKLGVFAQRYDALGATVGNEFKVNSNAADGQDHPVVAALADGGFVIAWVDDSALDHSGAGIFAQRYDAAGTRVGGETQVNSFTTDDQVSPEIVALGDGGYLIAWTRLRSTGDPAGIFAQRYDASGAAVGGENRLDGDFGETTDVAITALADGGYLATWVRTTDRVDVVAQRFDAFNAPMGPETIVTPSPATHGAPDVAQLAGGQVVVAWDSPARQPPLLTDYDVFQSLFSSASGVAETQYLFGTAQDETLDGGIGRATMWGGAGNDTYLVDDTSDLAVETHGQGTDTVMASVSYVLGGQYVENLILTGTASVNGAGNGLDNSLTGNGGANLLDGRYGADAMAGGAGDDTYVIDNAGDTVAETAGNGADTVRTAISYALGDNVENLTLVGSQALSATGNGLNNSLTGNNAANAIDGGDGSDWVRGLGGNDVLTGGAGADAFVFEAPGPANGFDTLADFQSGADHLVFRGSDFGLARGHHLSAAELILTGRAAGTAAQFIYNPVNHKLYWDSDGSGGANPIAICVFGNNAAPSAADFVFL